MKGFKSGELAKPKLALNCIGGKSAMELISQLDNKGCVVTHGSGVNLFQHQRYYWMTEWNKHNLGNDK